MSSGLAAYYSSGLSSGALSYLSSGMVRNPHGLDRECYGSGNIMPYVQQLVPVPCCEFPAPTDTFQFPPANMPLVPDAEIPCIPVDDLIPPITLLLECPQGDCELTAYPVPEDRVADTAGACNCEMNGGYYGISPPSVKIPIQGPAKIQDFTLTAHRRDGSVLAQKIIRYIIDVPNNKVTQIREGGFTFEMPLRHYLASEISNNFRNQTFIYSNDTSIIENSRRHHNVAVDICDMCQADLRWSSCPPIQGGPIPPSDEYDDYDFSSMYNPCAANAYGGYDLGLIYLNIVPYTDCGSWEVSPSSVRLTGGGQFVPVFAPDGYRCYDTLKECFEVRGRWSVGGQTMCEKTWNLCVTCPVNDYSTMAAPTAGATTLTYENLKPSAESLNYLTNQTKDEDLLEQLIYLYRN